MENVNELLETARMSVLDMEEIEDEIFQLHARAKTVLANLTLELFEHYKNGECYVPHIDDVSQERVFGSRREGVATILNWIRDIMPDIESCEEDGNEDIAEYVIDRMNFNMIRRFLSIQDAIRCIKHEIEKKYSRED